MTAQRQKRQEVPVVDSPLVRGEVAFRLLIEEVVDYAIFLLGPDGRVLTWNRGAQRAKGYTADEIVGAHFGVFYTPDERAAGRPDFALEQAAEFGRFEDEGWRVRKDGTQFWANAVLTALREEAGAPPYAFVKITRDLTERREAEEQQRTLLIEQRARAAAEEALAARERFLAIASHELKTPVATLQLATETLLRAKARGLLDEERLETGLHRILKATGRLGELMTELLDVSRLASDTPLARRTPTDVAAMVREVVERFDDPDSPPRITVEAPAEAWLDADGPRLDQVVSNLLDNALKYSSPDEQVGVTVIDDGREIRIAVADRGIGLDDSMTSRLFEAFGRGINAEHIQGLGLGLYISQQIVAGHGGRIEATPRLDGPGTEFTVILPRIEPTA